MQKFQGRPIYCTDILLVLLLVTNTLDLFPGAKIANIPFR